VAKLMPIQDEDLTIETRDREYRSQDPRNSDAVLIGFTSGTTGVPKGVMHGPSALNYVTRACAAVAGLVSGEAILGIMPLDSTAGFTFTAHFALSLGHPLVFMGRWNPLKAMERAQRYECRWTTGVPTHLFTMVEAARAGTWSGALPFRALAVGGSTMTRDLIADANTLLGLKALRMFGMSECMAHCSNHLEHPIERRQLFDGIPFPKTEVRVFGVDLISVQRGERGEAGVRGPALFLGYAQGLGAGQERMTTDGYYLTGDEIVRDGEGFVRVIGRFKDQIIRGGFNIDPAEVEAALLRHPAIAEVAVVGVPDLKLGEKACAVCRLRLGYPPIDLLTLQGHMASIGISQIKWPEYLVLVDSMRLLPIGKIDKKAMAFKAIEELSRQSGLT
jgi:acyl-CoA synthetase